MSEPTYIRKKVRRAIDNMIDHVVGFEPGEAVAGMELNVEHEDGDITDVTILVIRGAWHDYLLSQTADNFKFTDTVPVSWEGSS